MTDLQNLTVVHLQQILSIKEEIEALESRLATFTGGGLVAVKDPKPRWSRKMSISARAGIGAAQRARWAKLKGTKTEAAPKKWRKMSAAGRAMLAAAARSRWAKVKAAGKNRL